VHHSLRRTNFTAYKSLRHQHLGEVRQLLASRGPVPSIAFVPHSSALVRGIHISLTCRRADLNGDALTLLQGAYQGACFIDVVAGEVPLGAVIGSNRALIGVSGDDEIAVVFCAIDNLLKGGSGQAVQNMNLLFGFPEDAGLPTVGSWP
jgi:N-acetyl-gamma-glutamyl-phosphate reductase